MWWISRVWGLGTGVHQGSGNGCAQFAHVLVFLLFLSSPSCDHLLQGLQLGGSLPASVPAPHPQAGRLLSLIISVGTFWLITVLRIVCLYIEKVRIFFF